MIAELQVAGELRDATVAMPAFHDFADVADAVEAAGRVVVIDGDLVEGAFAGIDTPVLAFTRTPGGGLDGVATVLVLFSAPYVEGDSETQAHDRALGHLSAIRAGYIEVYGQRLLGIDCEPPVILDPSAGLPRAVEWSLMLRLEVTP